MSLKKISYWLLISAFIAGCQSEEKPQENSFHDNFQKEDSVKVRPDTLSDYDNVDKLENKNERIDSASNGIKKKVTPVSVPAQNIKSISKLWQTYKRAKADLEIFLEEDNLDSIIAKLKIAGECAEELGRLEIAAWQYNNIGHYSIQKFKKATDYETRIRRLATISSETDKTEYLTETKAIFFKHLKLLTRAENYLLNAQIIDDELTESRRTEVISSNIDFINWIKDFAGNN